MRFLVAIPIGQFLVLGEESIYAGLDAWVLVESERLHDLQAILHPDEGLTDYLPRIFQSAAGHCRYKAA